MAQPLILIICLSLISSFSIKASQAEPYSGEIFVYWGQNSEDGTLKATCDSGLYGTVILGFLDVFGSDRTPQLNFTSHCVGQDCSFLASDINHCQEKGVNVFLSLGGPYGNYSLNSGLDAYNIAKYLFKSFLSGQNGPLGRVGLNGIDFYIAAGSNSYWDDLVKDLDKIRKLYQFPLNLSAAPHCSYPDYYLDAAIQTGLFDHIFIRYYDQINCQFFQRNNSAFFLSWYLWSDSVANSTVFMTLPASPAASPIDAYISQDLFLTFVLPNIKSTFNFGGVVIWNRGYDVYSLYSYTIKPYLSSSCNTILYCHNTFQPKKITLVV